MKKETRNWKKDLIIQCICTVVIYLVVMFSTLAYVDSTLVKITTNSFGELVVIGLRPEEVLCIVFSYLFLLVLTCGILFLTTVKSHARVY